MRRQRRWGRHALGAASLALGAVLAWAGTAGLSFAPRVDVGLGPSGCEPDVDCSEGPVAVVAGDFDGDGKLDVATANNYSDDLTVLLGDGQGGLTPAFTAAVGDAPAGIATGHLDGGTTLDLVVSNESSASVSVLLGNGDGTFGAAESVEMGNSPETVVLADFNGDGKLDLATADLFGTACAPPSEDDCVTVSVRLGNGDGTFGELMQTVVAQDPGPVIAGAFGLAAANLDEGGVLDLVVSLNEDEMVVVLLGNGDGTFRVWDRKATEESPVGLTVADFDGDGHMDVAVANEFSDSVSVLLGNGDGTLADAVHYETGGFPEAVVAADFDGDRNLDLATADSFGTLEFPGSVSVLSGNGDGTFQTPQALEVDYGPYGLVAADLDGDRLSDIVSANVEGTDVSVLVNTGVPPPLPCVGDCDDDGTVAVNELIIGVNIALGNAGVDTCPNFDADGDGAVSINELISGVNNALNGCPDS